MVSLVGFAGSRSLPASFALVVAAVVRAVLAGGRGVAVGCARGADQAVRSAAPGAVVFAVASGRWGVGRGAFAARSIALVQAVAASGPGAGFVGFVAGPCPAGLVPSASPASCFSGLGSGSWASLALAAGLGLPVVVFPCGWRWSPPAWGGSWSPAGSGCWAGGWRWSPPAVAVQGALF